MDPQRCISVGLVQSGAAIAGGTSNPATERYSGSPLLRRDLQQRWVQVSGEVRCKVLVFSPVALSLIAVSGEGRGAEFQRAANGARRLQALSWLPASRTRRGHSPLSMSGTSLQALRWLRPQEVEFDVLRAHQSCSIGASRCCQD